MKKFLFSILCLFCAVMAQAETLTATYSVASKTTLSSSGNLPAGSMATYEQTYTTASQMTKGNSCTFTLAGYEGCKITGITLSMKSNKSAGSGSLSVKAGETVLSEIKTSTFKEWYGAYSTAYVKVNPKMTNADYTIKKDENVVVHIAATVNSLYCNGITVLYERVTEALAAPVITEPRIFTESMEVSLSCATDGATIHYTTDGSEPTKESAVYTASFTITETTTVKAISVMGDVESRVVEATYTLSESPLWILVTDETSLNVGDKVVLVSSVSDFAMSTNQKDNNRGAVGITKIGDGIIINDEVQILTLEAGTKTETFAFNTDKGYLYAASSSSNYLRTQQENNDNGSWKITISSDGVASIIAQGSNTRKVMQYNQPSTLFACYGSANQSAINIYKEVTEQTLEEAYELNINKYGYATLYLDKAVAVPEGLAAYYCTVDGTTAVLHEVGEVIPAATAVVLKGEANTTYTLANTAEVNGKAETIEAENKLIGYAVDTDVPMGADGYYALNVKDGVVGFFVPKTVSADKATFKAVAHKAYLKIEGAANAQMLTIREGADGGETSVESAMTDVSVDKVYYDLTGRRVENPKQGIYIVNGRKVVIR